jgi:hypothetical protein
MVDFKMRMEGQKPTPQRVAAGRALKDLAPRKYCQGVEDKDFTEFVGSVQKSWRILLSKLKEGGYARLDSKKFGYARNCPPVLVKASVPSDNGCQLVPCKLPLCPFCHGRTVMRAQDTLSSALDALSLDPTTTDRSTLGFQYGFFDITSTSLDGAHEKLEELWAEQSQFQGTVSKRSFWMRPASFAGRLSFVGINNLGGGYENHHYQGLKEAGSILDFQLSGYGWGPEEDKEDKPRSMISKYSGTALAYPKDALYLPDGVGGHEVAVLLNGLHERKWRLYRTTGICRANGAVGNCSSTVAWRRGVEKHMEQISAALGEIKVELRQLKEASSHE